MKKLLTKIPHFSGFKKKDNGAILLGIGCVIALVIGAVIYRKAHPYGEK